MSTRAETQLQLPRWLREAIEEAETMDRLPGKRREPRRVCTETFLGQLDDEACDQAFPVRGFNVNSFGLGFVAPRELAFGQRLSLSLADNPEEPPISLRVIHCARIARWYTIGCEFVPAQP